MAWIDDRVWCHPKLADVPKATRWVFVASIAYSSGFGTRGLLSPGQQEQIGSTSATKKQLVGAGLWENQESGFILIHDWDEHNDKRDDRRAKDRERKRQKRAEERGTVRRNVRGQSADKHEDVRALKEVKEVKEVKGFSLTANDAHAEDPGNPVEQPSIESITPNLREIA